MRNHLAHWTVDKPAFLPETGERLIGLSPRLPRTNAKPRSIKERPGKQRYQFAPGTLFVRDIVKARLDFSALRVSLERLARDLLGTAGSIPELDVQEGRVPQTTQLARQIREALSNPPEPSRA